MHHFAENTGFRVTLNNSEHASVSDLQAKRLLMGSEQGLMHRFPFHSHISYPLIVLIPLLHRFANSKDTTFQNEQLQLHCWDEKDLTAAI